MFGGDAGRLRDPYPFATPARVVHHCPARAAHGPNFTSVSNRSLRDRDPRLSLNHIAVAIDAAKPRPPPSLLLDHAAVGPCCCCHQAALQSRAAQSPCSLPRAVRVEEIRRKKKRPDEGGGENHMLAGSCGL
ncbi:hypothetical protein M0R45_001298 [Rubus argutus]|uniref:Uncharacterized protein n=1 Tax=Rubus argutus TaxID=59490 RepID=A0AAW1VNB8_RUBAR